jgi:hypothetical protein
MKIVVNDKKVTVVNDTYIIAVTDLSETQVPSIGVAYVYLQFSSDIWFDSYYTNANNEVEAFTDEQKANLVIIINDWQQPLGQEGNPSPEQIAKQAQQQALSNLVKTDVAMTTDMVVKMTPNEKLAMESYREAQFQVIQTPPTSTDPSNALDPALDPDLESAYVKFGLV